MRVTLEPLFVKYGVNVVYSGHDHVYERLKPQKGIYYFVSGSAGQDPVTVTLPGPSTVGVHCTWAPGASGGGWLIDGGREIDGLNAYVELSAKRRTFGPYFSASTVGRLVAGL